MGGLHLAAWTRILLHQQLAAGDAGEQPPHGRCDCLERAFVDYSAGGHRTAAGRLRPMELPGLAWAGAHDGIFPPPGLHPADAGAARHGVLFPGDGCALSVASAAGRRLAALPCRPFQLFRPRPARSCCPSMWPAPGTCSWPFSGWPPPIWPPEFFWCP